MTLESPAKPVPEVSDATRPYWDYLQREELRLPRCLQCGECFFYPRHWCPACFCQEFEWVKVSGRATVHSFSVVHQAAYESYQADVPYVVAIVALPEGPRMMANIVNCAVEDVMIDMPVEVTFERRAGGFTVPQFRPATQADQEPEVRGGGEGQPWPTRA